MRACFMRNEPFPGQENSLRVLYHIRLQSELEYIQCCFFVGSTKPLAFIRRFRMLDISAGLKEENIKESSAWLVL